MQLDINYEKSLGVFCLSDRMLLQTTIKDMIEESRKKHTLVSSRYKKRNTPKSQAQPKLKKQRKKGEGVVYNEPKQKLYVTITPTVFAILEDIAIKHDISKSEAIERTYRGTLPFDTILEQLERCIKAIQGSEIHNACGKLEALVVAIKQLENGK